MRYTRPNSTNQVIIIKYDKRFVYINSGRKPATADRTSTSVNRTGEDSLQGPGARPTPLRCGPQRTIPRNCPRVSTPCPAVRRRTIPGEPLVQPPKRFVRCARTCPRRSACLNGAFSDSGQRTDSLPVTAGVNRFGASVWRMHLNNCRSLFGVGDSVVPSLCELLLKNARPLV